MNSVSLHWCAPRRRLLERHCAVCCVEKSCDLPPRQVHGHQHATLCTGPHLLDTICQYECDSGYKLPASSVSRLECVIDDVGGSDLMKWHDQPSDCEGNTAQPHYSSLHYQSQSINIFVFPTSKNVYKQWIHTRRKKQVQLEWVIIIAECNTTIGCIQLGRSPAVAGFAWDLPSGRTRPANVDIGIQPFTQAPSVDSFELFCCNSRVSKQCTLGNLITRRHWNFFYKHRTPFWNRLGFNNGGATFYCVSS